MIRQGKDSDYRFPRLQPGVKAPARRPKRDPTRRSMKIGANRKPAAAYATPLGVIDKQQKELAASQAIAELDDFEMEQDEIDQGEDDDHRDGLESDNSIARGTDGPARSRSDSHFDELGDEQDYQVETDAGDSISALFDQFLRQQRAESQRLDSNGQSQSQHIGGYVVEEQFDDSQESRRDIPIDPSLSVLSRGE